jgi:hypothetical protein
MSQCLRCSEACAENTVFCKECQVHSENWSIFAPMDVSFEENEVSPFSTLPLSESEVITSDQTADRLDAAARWIEEEEANGKRLRRSLRLTPLRDISAEIQRASTPHPQTRTQSGLSKKPETKKHPKGPDTEEKSSDDKKLGKVWPWLNLEDEEEEKESDLWADSTDPLLARTRPTTANAAQIEAEDIKRAQLENHKTLPYPTIHRKKGRRLSRRQIAFLIIATVACLALVIDMLLLTFDHPKNSLTSGGGPPTLTLSGDVANVGDTMSVHLIHFVPSTSVVLTHDVQETLLTTTHSSALTINKNGEADALFLINHAWQPGSHLIVAEDVTTRDTASAILLISGEGPSRPPHLLLDSSSLNLGNAVQGADTLQPLQLHNTGSGSITWSVSSNQPWLFVAPQQGTFGSEQTISVAVQRSNLQPNDYTGALTIFSNVGEPEQIQVKMKVSALPPNAGPVISLSPPLFSFTNVDGNAHSTTQILTLSNPGQEDLNWSLSKGDTLTTSLQSPYSPQSDQGRINLNAYPNLDNSPAWLSVSPSSGSLASGQSTQVSITVQSQNLLPGTYMSMLTFSADQGTQAYDTPQIAGVALTVQPHCGLVTSAGSLSFTAVTGQSNPSAHVLGLNTTSSCSGTALAWQALHSADWITLNPDNGQIKGTNSNFTSIGVNTAGLAPGQYTGMVTFLAGQDTQTVTVRLTLQPSPAPTVPILGALPLSINFSTIQGQSDSVGQVVTITNNGGSQLRWHTNVNQLGSSWVAASPTSGSVHPGQTDHLTVNVATKNLTPGNYIAQVTLLGTDTKGNPASGSPQIIMVNLTVQPPCTLAAPSASSLLFNGIAGGPNPASQTVTLMGTGSCAWPLHWSTSVTTTSPWLTLNPASGTLNTATQQGSITVGVNTNGLQPGTYVAQVTLSASDSTGMPALNSPLNFTVTLTVQQPCTLQQLPSTLSFNAAVSTQTLNISSTGSCRGGVAWTATTDPGSNTWLSLSATSGTDNGSGSSIGVTATAGNLPPGNYTGQITVSASNNGVVLAKSPQTTTVTFTIASYTVSGTAIACSGPSPDCTTSQGLANAVVLLTSNGVTISTVTTDGSGNFSFTSIPPGSYTISVNGNSGSAIYTGTLTLTVNGNTSGITVQTFSS